YAGVLGLGTAPSLTARVKAADLVIVVGDRLSEAVTGSYSLIDPQNPSCTLVHIHPDPNELGRVYQADLMINASVGEFALAAQHLSKESAQPDANWAQESRAEYEALLARQSHPDSLDLRAMIASLNEILPDKAIITNGAGAYAA